MTRRYLSEPEAWREIARRIAEGEWTRVGLCREIKHLYREERISDAVCCLAVARTDWHVDQLGRDGLAWNSMEQEYNEVGAWLEPEGEADVRVLAALFLALEAESEPA